MLTSEQRQALESAIGELGNSVYVHHEKIADGLRSILASAAPAEGREPYAYIYEYDTPYGVHRRIDYGTWNGRYPDRTVPVFATTPTKAAEPEWCERCKCAVPTDAQGVAEHCARFAELYRDEHAIGREVEEACNEIAEACRSWGATAPTMSQEIVGYLIDDPNEPDIGHWFDEGKPNRDLGLRARPLTFAAPTMSEAANLRRWREKIIQAMRAPSRGDFTVAVDAILKEMTEEINRIDRAAAKEQS